MAAETLGFLLPELAGISHEIPALSVSTCLNAPQHRLNTTNCRNWRIFKDPTGPVAMHRIFQNFIYHQSSASVWLMMCLAGSSIALFAL
jgi:hypothetical protein